MTELVMTDVSVVLNSVDLSDHVTGVTLNYSVAIMEKTAMGDTFNTRLAGVKDWTVSLEFNQDYAASNVDATLWAASGSSVPIVIKPTSGAVSATNPSWSGNCFVESYDPLAGSYGEVIKTSPSIVGDDTLARNVT